MTQKQSSKHHYRNVAKSDHLSHADLEDMQENGHNLIFKISKSQQFQGKDLVEVAGRKINANIIHFDENGVKPMVVNITNGEAISKLAGSSFIEDWIGTVIKLYVDKNVRMKGETVSGIRVSPTAPKIEKPDLTMDNKSIDVIASYWNGGKKDKVLSKFNVSKEIERQLEAMKKEAKS